MNRGRNNPVRQLGRDFKDLQKEARPRPGETREEAAARITPKVKEWVENGGRILEASRTTQAAMDAKKPEEIRRFPDGTVQPLPFPDGAGITTLLHLLRPWHVTIQAGPGYVEVNAWDAKPGIEPPEPEMLGIRFNSAGPIDEPGLAATAYIALWRALAMRHGAQPEGLPAREEA